MFDRCSADFDGGVVVEEDWRLHVRIPHSKLVWCHIHGRFAWAPTENMSVNKKKLAMESAESVQGVRGVQPSRPSSGHGIPLRPRGRVEHATPYHQEDADEDDQRKESRPRDIVPQKSTQRKLSLCGFPVESTLREKHGECLGWAVVTALL